MAKIIMPDGVEPFDLEDEIANDDALLRQALAVAYPDAKNAEFKRETKDGVMSVRVTKKAGTKGGVLDDLAVAPDAINPAIVLDREIAAREAAGEISLLDLIAMQDQIKAALEAGEAEVESARAARRTLEKAPAVAGAAIPRGF